MGYNGEYILTKDVVKSTSKSLAREVALLRKENETLRAQVSTIKANNSRHVYQLNIVTRSQIGVDDVVKTCNKYYAKKKDVLNDIKYEYFTLTNIRIPEHENPEELVYHRDKYSVHLRITEINII